MIGFARVQANFDISRLDVRQGIFSGFCSAVSKIPTLCLILWVLVAFNSPFTCRVFSDFDGLLLAYKFYSDDRASVRFRFDRAFGPVVDIL